MTDLRVQALKDIGLIVLLGEPETAGHMMVLQHSTAEEERKAPWIGGSSRHKGWLATTKKIMKKYMFQ